jgi:hypothetical protein
MKTTKLMVGTALLALMGAASGHAMVVSSLPSGTLVPMPAFDTVDAPGPGPHTFGPGITWSSTNPNPDIFSGSVFGYTGGYGFASNGFWDGVLGPMAGLNSSTDSTGVTDTMTFAFSSPVFGVGGFLNYTPFSLNPTVIAIYDESHTLLESFELTFLTDSESTNAGEFWGFSRESADIKYFTLTDNYVGITHLTVDGSPAAAVPEPGTLLLLGVGMAGLATQRRRA